MFYSSTHEGISYNYFTEDIVGSSKYFIDYPTQVDTKYRSNFTEWDSKNTQQPTFPQKQKDEVSSQVS